MAAPRKKKKAAPPPAEEPAPTTNDVACPYCFGLVPKEATRCKHCAGELLFCPKCKQNVKLKKSVYVRTIGGPQNPVAHCATCGTKLMGPDCFIATAAFGSPTAHEVHLLREFRDRHLLLRPSGRAFVDIYYAVSPSIARYIRHNKHAKRLVRFLLCPLLFFARYLQRHNET